MKTKQRNQSGFIMVMAALFLMGAISSGLMLSGVFESQNKTAEQQRVISARDRIQRQFDNYAQMPYMLKFSASKADSQIVTDPTKLDQINIPALQCMNGTANCTAGSFLRVNLYSPFALSTGENISGSEPQSTADTVPARIVRYSTDGTPCSSPTATLQCPFEVYTSVEVICSAGAACQPANQLKLHYKIRVAPQLTQASASQTDSIYKALGNTREFYTRSMQNSIMSLFNSPKIDVEQMLNLYPLPGNQGTLAGRAPSSSTGVATTPNNTATSAGTNNQTLTNTPDGQNSRNIGTTPGTVTTVTVPKTTDAPKIDPNTTTPTTERSVSSTPKIDPTATPPANPKDTSTTAINTKCGTEDPDECLLTDLINKPPMGYSSILKVKCNIAQKDQCCAATYEILAPEKASGGSSFKRIMSKASCI